MDQQEGEGIQVTVHDAFMAMYYALEAATVNYSDQGLKTFVQDCEPFVWKDCLSADPAVYAEFSEAFSASYGEQAVSAEEAHAFCRGWLEKQAATHEFYQTRPCRNSFMILMVTTALPSVAMWQRARVSVQNSAALDCNFESLRGAKSAFLSGTDFLAADEPCVQLGCLPNGAQPLETCKTDTFHTLRNVQNRHLPYP